jgi:hypothetical protein
MVSSRERIQRALSHQEPDRIPLDLGGSVVTGMHVSSVYKLRQALALDPAGTPVRVIEPYQMLGEIGPDLVERLGVDVLPLMRPTTTFGFQNEGWKPWKLFDGTPALVPAGFNTDAEPNGDILIYPQGDKSAPPAGRMPHGGWYFDSIQRHQPVDDRNLRVEDNLEEFGPISADELDHLRVEAERLYTDTEKAILADFGGTAFGDISEVPGPSLRHPKGIRDMEEWYISTTTRRDHLKAIFARQCAIGIANLEQIYQAVGDRVTVIYVSGTDFGTQQGPFLSVRTYCELYQPFHRQVNDWIHEHTPWKTFLHTCGSVMPLVEHFIDAGFDILNPVQWNAANMSGAELMARFGDRITFWGGGVNTQYTLPFGTPDEVRKEVWRSIDLFGKGGGFVFSAIHNVQPQVPVENLLALFEAVAEYGGSAT